MKPYTLQPKSASKRRRKVTIRTQHDHKLLLSKQKVGRAETSCDPTTPKITSPSFQHQQHHTHRKIKKVIGEDFAKFVSLDFSDVFNTKYNFTGMQRLCNQGRYS